MTIYKAKHTKSFRGAIRIQNFPFDLLSDQQLREEIILSDAILRGMSGRELDAWQHTTDFLVAAAKEKRRRAKAHREMLRFG